MIRGTLLMLLVLVASPAAAQTRAELLEEALYLEDTVGDEDEAIVLYRRILSTPSTDKRAAAVAERRLAALAKRPDTAGVGRSHAPDQRGDAGAAPVLHRPLASDMRAGAPPG